MTAVHIYNCISFTKIPSEVTASVALQWQLPLAIEDKF